MDASCHVAMAEVVRESFKKLLKLFKLSSNVADMLQCLRKAGSVKYFTESHLIKVLRSPDIT
jgi:hypothetical protein